MTKIYQTLHRKLKVEQNDKNIPNTTQKTKGGAIYNYKYHILIESFVTNETIKCYFN